MLLLTPCKHVVNSQENEDDMMILAKAAIPNCNVTPHLGAILLFHLERQVHQTRGDITCGGIETILATALAINVSELQPLYGERRVSYTTL
jgi:hypothetical protein